MARVGDDVGGHGIKGRVFFKSRVVEGLWYRGDALRWLTGSLLSTVLKAQRSFLAAPGTLLSLVPCCISFARQSYLYSAIVEGMAEPYTSLWAFGRMETLCMQVIVEAIQILERTRAEREDRSWHAIETFMCVPRGYIELSIMVAPHRLDLAGGVITSPVFGVAERADIVLVASVVNPHLFLTSTNGLRPRAVIVVYHTMYDVGNALVSSYGTCGIDNYWPESRLLWKEICDCYDLRSRTMNQLMKSLYQERGWPLRSLDAESSASILAGLGPLPEEFADPMRVGTLPNDDS